MPLPIPPSFLPGRPAAARPGFAALLLSLLALAFAAPLRAQDVTEPSVTFSPDAGTFTSPSLLATVRFWDDVWPDTLTRVIVLNGQVVTDQFQHTPVAPRQFLGPTTSSTATLALQPGVNTLAASVCDTAGNCSTPLSRTYTYAPGSPAVRVGPDGAVASAAAGVAKVHPFRVVNPGTAPGSYTLRAECRDAWTGSRLPGCGVSAASVSVAAGDSVTVSVTSPAAAAGAAQLVRLVAEVEGMPGVSDAGWVDVDVAGSGGSQAAPLVAAVDLNHGPVLERGECVTVAVAARAAYECGDLRVAHALPAHRTLNRAWVPVLLYNSQHAHPRPTVYADVTVPASASVPNTVQVTVSMATGEQHTATFPGSHWTPGATRRVAVQWDGVWLVTSLYAYTLQVTSHYASASFPSGTTSGEVAVVARPRGPFGAGWWLAGWEQFVCVDCYSQNQRRLWVGGDGSTRVYTSTPGGPVWTSPHPDAPPDTIIRMANGDFVRRLPGGGRIEFNPLGQHVRTVNRLGQTTTFQLQNGWLTGIEAPVPPGGGTAPAWTLTYAAFSGGSRLITVTATAPGAPPRQVTLAHGGGDWRVTGITDPDGLGVAFGYPSGPDALRIESLTNRRQTYTSFGYDAAGKLSSVRVRMDSAASGNDLITTFEAGESRGVAPSGGSGVSVAVSQAYTLLDGARTDVADHTRLWLTSRGAPRRIRDALGAETLLARTDARFPALVTQVRGPTARGDSLVVRSSAVYDARGRITRAMVHNPLGDNANTATWYTYDDRWNAPDTITATGVGDVAMAYDTATGNMLWRQQGGASRRVYFDYGATGQVIRIRYPDAATGAAGGGGRDSLVYDALGNLNRTVSPLGFVTLFYRDALGRVVETISPVHAGSSSDSASVAGTGLRQTVAYDLMGRDTLSRTLGRAMTLGRQSGVARVLATPAETVTVRQVYDGEGLPLKVERWATPDTAHVGVLTMTYVYDAAGRKTAERDDVKDDYYTYDAAGNLVQHLTPRVHTITMTYDALGRMTRRVTPGVIYGPSDVNCSDPYNPQEPNAPRWAPCTFPFPRFPNNSSGGWTIPADTAYFAFDAAGSMVRAQNGDAIVTRTYFPGGALRTDSLRIRAYGAGSWQHKYGLEYRYDAAGRTRALLHPSNLAGAAQRDSFAYETVTGALQTVVGRTNLSFGYEYDLLGRLTSETMPGTSGNSYLYDLEGRRTSRAGIYGETFTYDARGKVLSASVTGRSTFRNYYSGLGMLAATEWDNDNNAAVEVEEFHTDALGHQVWRRTASAENNGHNPEHVTRYREGTSRVYEVQFAFPADSMFMDSTRFARDTTFRTYDLAGNVQDGTERAWGSSYRKVQTRSYYGADGKLRAQQGYSELGGWYFTGERRGYFSEYRYDALGRRVLVRTRRDGLCQTTQTNTVDCTSGIERFVWAGDNILWEMRGPGGDTEPAERLEQVDATGVEFGIVGYTHAGGVDRPLVAYKTAGGNAGAVVVPHMNWRGLFSLGTNPSGGASTTPVEWPGFRTTAWHYAGETQGTTKNWMGSLLEGQRDAGGLMYMRNRYYDPATGQFTQTDPIGIAGGLNTYGFANGDPVSYDDPYGLCPPCRGNENTTEAVEREAQMVESRSGRDALIEGTTVALGVAGGIVFLAASTEAAIASAPTLAARARELHGALSAATQRRATTAVARVTTQSGRIETWVASSERVLRPAQRAMLRAGERAIRGGGHAEQTIINTARAEGANVEVIAASRPICPVCARAIEGARALFGSVLKN